MNDDGTAINPDHSIVTEYPGHVIIGTCGRCGGPVIMPCHKDTTGYDHRSDMTTAFCFNCNAKLGRVFNIQFPAKYGYVLRME